MDYFFKIETKRRIWRNLGSIKKVIKYERTIGNNLGRTFKTFDNFKDYCDKATDNNDDIIITRKDEKMLFY